jgi:2'-5'-oligoadenylate synthetase
MELRKTRATELDKFIEDHLLPDTELHKQVKATIQIICKFLKERCFQGATHPVWVSEVVKVRLLLPVWAGGTEWAKVSQSSGY